MIEDHYPELATWLRQQQRPGKSFFLGINGAPGTGKSTLAAYLQLTLEVENNLRVVVLSIDDYYLGHKDRQRLGEQIHPLLRTRGVPGTHDMQMLARCVEKLEQSGQGSTLSLPRFDKALDDRSKEESWPVVSGPFDLIILEGWCVGSTPQPEAALLQPVNALEKEHDANGVWRRYVNDRLGQDYANLFAKLDAMIFLEAPNFDAIHRWRLEQEEKLAETTPHNSANLMNSEQLAVFIQHYERLCKKNLATMPGTADAVVVLDDNHDCVRISYAKQPQQDLSKSPTP